MRTITRVRLYRVGLVMVYFGGQMILGMGTHVREADRIWITVSVGVAFGFTFLCAWMGAGWIARRA
jgi:hypothetical protein